MSPARCCKLMNIGGSEFAVDLVILNERKSSYVQDLQVAIETLVRASQSRPAPGLDRPLGRVFVLRADLIAAAIRSLLVSTARIVLVAQQGSLSDQLDRIANRIEPTRPLKDTPIERPQRPPALRASQLEFFNGLGGFAEGGKEYVTILGPGQSTPSPWINVIANPGFGFQTATEGSGYTWSSNSHENQLTPWSNDPVSDSPGEAFYVRDDKTGNVWSPTAAPIREASGTYVARHGRGYSRFEYVSRGISANLLQYVPVKDRSRYRAFA